ncbi:hypothetical protein CASFOL_006727 [Castilleja foliolosa]|uniref:Uncharacterized protein n=1 Tax=Castilleja foliolosa TaxID=1961234 RepID=A0ABD3E849_9LAMI
MVSNANCFDLSYARERFRNCFPGKIDRNSCHEWIKAPINIALSVWIVCVAISGSILLMLTVGMLDRALPEKSERDVWAEANNQVLNALFTLMCVFQHSTIIRHTVLLSRWRRSGDIDDVLRVRKIYCKDGARKPHERAHAMVVVILLHVSFVAQYVLCGLYWGYGKSDRPSTGVRICMGITIVAPAFAGAYVLFSPLGRDYETTMDSIGSDVDDVENICLVAKNGAKNGCFPCRCSIMY